MKRNIIDKIFICIFVLIIAAPVALMGAFKSDTTTENRRLAEFPVFSDESGINTDYLSELGDYITDHFAFRQHLIYLDSIIQATVFKTSNTSEVIAGDNDWLYYSATLSDYQKNEPISDRGLYNIAHNLRLMQNYVMSNSSDFIFTVAPNKNSLYPENMPYYNASFIDEQSNMERLKPLLEKENVNYIDLFELLGDSEQTLYFKRDSHWNNKGAAIVHNAILSALGTEHIDYTEREFKENPDYSGDLNKLLFPLTNFRETDFEYELENGFTYLTKGESVEDAWIVTENANGSGSALVYRDSFGNTLLPFLADSFEKTSFSKSACYNVALNMTTSMPQYVIAQKVERNIYDFAKMPPVLPACECDVTIADSVETASDCKIERCQVNTSYLQISGKIEGIDLTDQRIFVAVEDESESYTFEAFGMSDSEGDNGYIIYVPEEKFIGEKVSVKIIVDDVEVCSTDLSLTEIEDIEI